MRIQFNDFELDEATNELRQEGVAVQMEPQVFRVLVYLAERRDRAVTKEELLDGVWGDRFVSESALSTRIKQARQAVGDDGRSQNVIKTLHGLGYRFVAPVTTSDVDDDGSAIALPPISLTPLVGRTDDLAAIAAMVRDHRLVTLTGAGGVGKTRLAADVARELADELTNSPLWLELAPVTEADALPAAVATALDITTPSNQDTLVSVASALSRREVLIVLDNCEHLITAAADLVRTVLARSASVKFLTTSREHLGVEGERIYAVPPLDTTGAAESPAVELFVQRAQALSTGYSPTEDLDAIAEICQRLDGIALAIELAAARTVTMSPRQICDRLNDRFHLLSSTRASVDRHQTLRQAVSWSYDLLETDERRMLQCCSVFADGFNAKAAVAVCGDDFDEIAGIDVLESLVRKSLLSAERVGDGMRFDMLETVKQYAGEALEQAGNAMVVKRCHAEHFAALAYRAYADWRGPQQPRAHAWFRSETANLRVAFAWAAEQDDLVTAGRIAAHATIVGWLQQRYEPADWAEQIAERCLVARTPELPRVLAAASMAMFTGREDAAVAHIERAREFENSDDFEPFEADLVLTLHGLSHAFNGNHERWVEIVEPYVDDPVAGHAARGALLWNYPLLGRSEEARKMGGDVVARAREIGNPMWIAWALAGVGRAEAVTNPEGGLRASRKASAYAHEMRLPFYEALNARALAELEALHGEFEVGAAMYQDTLHSLHTAGATTHLSIAFANLASFFTHLDEPAVAATLIGVARQAAGSVTMAVDGPATSEQLTRLLGPAEFERCVAAGRAMLQEEAVQFADDQIETARAKRNSGA